MQNPLHCSLSSGRNLDEAEETESGRARERGTKREREEEREWQSTRERHTHGTSFWRSGTEKPIMGTWTLGKGRRNISKKQVPRLRKPPQKQVPQEKVLGTCKFWRPGVCTREEHRWRRRGGGHEENNNNKNAIAIAIVVQAPLFRPPLHNNILCPRSQTERGREGQKRHMQQETRNQEENVLGRSSSWVED